MRIIIKRKKGDICAALAVAGALKQFREKFPTHIRVKSASVYLTLEFSDGKERPYIVDSEYKDVEELMLDDNGVLVNTPEELIPAGRYNSKYKFSDHRDMRLVKIEQLNMLEPNERQAKRIETVKLREIAEKMRQEKEEERWRIAAERRKAAEERKEAKKMEHDLRMETDETYRNEVLEKRRKSVEKSKATRQARLEAKQRLKKARELSIHPLK